MVWSASFTYKLKNNKQVKEFLKNWDRNISFIAEEYIDGLVETFDGITDSQGNILICTSHVMMESIMDTVNEGGDTAFMDKLLKVVILKK